MKYELCAKLLAKYSGDDIRELIAEYKKVVEDNAALQRKLEDMNLDIIILNTENQILKIDTGYEE